MSEMRDSNLGKEAAAAEAVKLVEEGMRIGLGTGTTASHFIKRLAERCRQGLRIEAVATSQRSSELAEGLKIPLIEINSTSDLDLAVDGADELDAALRLIKGGGGALFREKVVAQMSRRFVVIADESKKVDFLGRFPLAVEILPFGWRACEERLGRLGFKGAMRRRKDGQFFVTDNGNHIFDISLSYPCKNPEEVDCRIRSVTGVIETGFFFNTAALAIVGYSDGHTEIIEP